MDGDGLFLPFFEHVIPEDGNDMTSYDYIRGAITELMDRPDKSCR